ncbi:MAG: hypothetical protein L6Q81_00730 [Bacteroidia bacterium]|nr:hypothetical protein [Bacteroidia bacterium]
MKAVGKSTLLLFSSILLCWIAFYNGYPLVYSDTGTYLESGFTLETPLDRPIMYGIFIRLASLNGFSVWTIVFAQSLLLIWLIRETLITLFGEQKSDFRFAITALILSIITGLSVVASQLIADLFTPISILSLFLFLFGKQGKRTTFFIGLIFLIACACHISHVMICFSIAFIVAVCFFYRRRKGSEVMTRTSRVTISLLIPLAALATMLSAVSKSRHVFMMGHLIETGILKEYLNDHCPDESNPFCEYKDNLPSAAEPFIWNLDGDSLLIRTGGWLGSKKAYSEIISATFSDTKYIKMHISAAIAGTMKQLTWIRVGEGLGKYDSTTLVSQRLKKYFPDSNDDYLQSRQSADEFSGSRIIDTISKTAIVVSLTVILLWFVYLRRIRTDRLLSVLILCVGLGYIVNCAVSATFAVVANRFGARLSWLAVLLALFIIFEWLSYRKKLINK